MRFWLAAVLAFAAAPGLSQEDPAHFERCLEILVEQDPDISFSGGSRMPREFVTWLAARKIENLGGFLFPREGDRRGLTNRRVRELYREFRPPTPPPPPTKPPEKKPRERNLLWDFDPERDLPGDDLDVLKESVRRETDRWKASGAPGGTPETDRAAAGRRFDGFDDEPGLVTLATIPLGEKRRKSTSTRGLRIQGFDISEGLDPDHEAEDPFLSPGIERLLDWDVKIKVRQESLGFKANYRNPMVLERLSVSFSKDADVPELLGAGNARDSVLGWLGKGRDEEKKDGYRLDASAVLNPHWGFGLNYREREREKPGSRSFERGEGAAVGFTPLGHNDGKPWNYSLFASVNHQDIETRDIAEGRDRKKGYGYAAGIAFQHALDQVPFPLIGRGEPEGFSFQHLRVSLSAGDSEISEFAVRAALEITCRITRHLRLSAGVDGTYAPDEKDFDLGHKLGFGIHW